MAQNVNGNGRDAGNPQSASQDEARRHGARRDEASRPSEDAALRARLDSLSSELDAKRQQEAAEESREIGDSAQTLGKAISLGFRVLTEFVAAVGVGAAIGWQLDVWFHTQPILLIVFLGLGTAAGFVNIYRAAAAPTAPKREDRK